MPRFEYEGFNSKKRINNENKDRTVPEEEKYYGGKSRGNEFLDGSVRDNQGINPCRPDEYEHSFDNNEFRDNYPAQSDYGSNPYDDMIDRFESEKPSDFEYSPQGESRTRGMQSNRRHAAKHKNDKGNNGKGKNGKKRHISLGKRILAVILAIIVIIIGSVFPVLGRIVYDDGKDNQYVNASELQSSAMIKNILLLGVDARPKDDAQASRSDSMMLISIDMKHRCIKMTSFLRDTWVYIPCVDKEQRLNAACQYGGYSGVVDTIEYNFGVKIDNYVVADFEMFKILVDSIGGVEIDVTAKEAKEVTNHPKRYGNVTLEEGKNVLTGEQALAYCRIRKIDTDFMRAKRQRTVMTSIIGKAKRSNPFSLYKMAYNAAPYIETDMSKSALIALVAQAGICASSTHQTRVPFNDTWKYATISGNSVISIDKDKNKELLVDFIYNKTSSQLTQEEAQSD